MHIERISIQNYKSLKNIDLSLKPLSVLVGANASGKSNFADCVDFVAEVYRHGLEIAVGRKGGYENIAYRRTRRSKQPIKIDLSVRLSSEDNPYWSRRSERERLADLRVEHSFSFVARGYSIRADFHIVSETINISTLRGETWTRIAQFVRDNETRINISPESAAQKSRSSRERERRQLRNFLGLPDVQSFKQVLKHAQPSNTELLMNFISRFAIGLLGFRRAVEGIRVFQLSPTKSREFGVPTPRPELDRSGANLPAVVDLMKKSHPKEWEQVLQTMRGILPGLETIDVAYTSSRTLGLFFNERGVGRPWSVDEISDGTIQTLGLLVAIFDPTSTALVLEEPENSVHPWIIRQILSACREASKNKQILITTHSPIVINAVHPNDVWVIWKADGSSHIKELDRLDTNFTALWGQGDVPTFEFLDSGVLAEAIPPSPSDDLMSKEKE